jgi:hypothetical protein
MSKGIAGRQYQVTDLAKEVIPVILEFENTITQTVIKYKSEIDKIADKYNIEQSHRDGLMTAMMDYLPAEFIKSVLKKITKNG